MAHHKYRNYVDHLPPMVRFQFNSRVFTGVQSEHATLTINCAQMPTKWECSQKSDQNIAVLDIWGWGKGGEPVIFEENARKSINLILGKIRVSRNSEGKDYRTAGLRLRLGEGNPAVKF